MLSFGQLVRSGSCYVSCHNKSSVLYTTLIQALTSSNADYNYENGFSMHELKTEIEIEATPARVWSILLDFPSYPDWNPFVCSVKGIAKEGDRLTISVQPQGGPMKNCVSVDAFF